MGHHWLVADNMHGERLLGGKGSPLLQVPHISLLLPHSPSTLTPEGPLTLMNVSVFALPPFMSREMDLHSLLPVWAWG